MASLKIEHGMLLVACEESGETRDAFMRRGYKAISCDLQPCRTNGPHYHGDVTDILWKYQWAGIIAHPPCTYLCNSGLHWNKRVPGRAKLTEQALEFVDLFLDHPCPKIVIENPMGCISTRRRKYDQVIQPWQFGHNASKTTCLWLKGLPPLKHTRIVPPDRYICCKRRVDVEKVGIRGCPLCCGARKALPRWANQTDSGQSSLGPSEDRAKIRSQTYREWSEAMADQWGPLIFGK